MEAIFRSVFEAIHSVVNDYGITVILFTVFIRLIQLPFDYKSRKSMRKMEKVNPQLQALQKKYANDKEKLQKKQMELYKKEGISPLSGCWPMLLTLPIMFIMLGALRSIANEQMVAALQKVQDAVGTLGLGDKEAVIANLPPLQSLLTPFLWIKNLWMPDSPFSAVLPTTSSALAAMGGGDAIAALRQFVDGDVYRQIIIPAYNLSVVPGAAINLLIVNWEIFKLPNGFLVLPVLSFITQFLSNKYLMQTQQTQIQEGQKGTGMMTKWMMPIIFSFFCVSYTASFALYIVVSTVIHVGQTKLFNIWLSTQDQRAAALKEEVDKL